MNRLFQNLQRVRIGFSRTVHYRNPVRRQFTVCGRGPAPFHDRTRGVVEPASNPSAIGPMTVTEEPVTCPKCMIADGGERLAA